MEKSTKIYIGLAFILWVLYFSCCFYAIGEVITLIKNLN